VKDLYQLPKGYILNPFDFLYQDNDVPISDNEAIQYTLQNIIAIDKERLDRDLAYLEHLIQLDSLSYIRKGCIYATIKFKKLYKHLYASFEEYCIKVLGRSVDTVNNAIEAARVMIELITMGLAYEDLPPNMSCAVQLKQFTGIELLEKWEYVLDNIPRHKRTVNSIRALLFPPVVSEDMTYKSIELPLDVYSRLVKIAHDAKLSVPKAIDSVVQILRTTFKKSEIVRLLKWQLDLIDLLAENS
jgi:hypothetical protein